MQRSNPLRRPQPAVILAPYDMNSPCGELLEALGIKSCHDFKEACETLDSPNY